MGNVEAVPPPGFVARLPGAPPSSLTVLLPLVEVLVLLIERLIVPADLLLLLTRGCLQ